MEVYEFELEKLEELDKESINEANKKNILNAQVNVDVLIGKSKQSIGEILKLSIGDIITLDKNIDQKLEVYVNDNEIANGESIILDNKIAIRISESESSDEN